MPGSVIKYHFGAIGAAQEDIAATATRLNQVHGDIQTYMNRLRATWTESQASAAWQGYQATWDGIFADVNSALASLGRAVEQALANAQRTESTNASMW